MTTVSDALNKAIQYHQNGNVQEAELIYTEVLKVDPTNINCLYLMGLINYQKESLIMLLIMRIKHSLLDQLLIFIRPWQIYT